MTTEPPALFLVPADSELRLPVLARVRTYPDLRQAIAARRQQLGLSQMMFDELAGTARNYISKIEVGMKHFGDMSLSVTLATLGLEILIIEADLPRTVQQFLEERRRAEFASDHAARYLQRRSM